jgi:hypothetical protein
MGKNTQENEEGDDGTKWIKAQQNGVEGGLIA